MSKNFTAITTKYKGRQLILHQQIILKADDKINTIKKEKKYNAIWDTGATNTVVSKEVAKEMKLIPVGKVEVSTANGKTITDKYIISLEFPNQLTINDMEVTGGNLGDNVDMLLGMDIISLGDFSVTNVDNKTTFTFRFPSCETIDYCKEARVIKNKNNLKILKEQEKLIKQHGNERCPCGSGRKYRYCCGRKKLEEIQSEYNNSKKDTANAS